MIVLISSRKYLKLYLYHGEIFGKGNMFFWVHVFIVSLNSINVGEFLKSYGSNSHNWAALYVTVSVPYRMVF